MATHGVSELLLHNFPENGVKFLLHNPGNLEDLLRLLAARHKTLPVPDRFDFPRRNIEPDTNSVRHAISCVAKDRFGAFLPRIGLRDSGNNRRHDENAGKRAQFKKMSSP